MTRLARRNKTREIKTLKRLGRKWAKGRWWTRGWQRRTVLVDSATYTVVNQVYDVRLDFAALE